MDREGFLVAGGRKNILRSSRVTYTNPTLFDKIFLYSFIREMTENPDMLFWFSKPETAMNKRLNEHLGKQEKKEQKMREKIISLREKFNQYSDHLQLKL